MRPKEALLMTGTIHPQNVPMVAISDHEERLIQYLCGLISWIKFTNISPIIFCENTNTGYDFSKIIEFAKNQGTVLEALTFEGNQESSKYGKGYGEGKILEYALSNSKYLQENNDFYKITGRLFVRNFSRLQEDCQSLSNVFSLIGGSVLDEIEKSIKNYPKRAYGTKKINILQYYPLGKNLFSRYMRAIKQKGIKSLVDKQTRVNTTFFKSNVDFFKKNLLSSYKRVNDIMVYPIECAYYDDLPVKSFDTFPEKIDFVGRSGTSGQLKIKNGSDFTQDIQRCAKNFL